MLNLDQIFDEVAVMLAEELSGIESTRFRNALKKDIVQFRYRKKDGSTRKARGTLKKDVLPAYGERRRPRPNRNGFVYWDVDKGSFRSFLRVNFLDWEKPKKKRSEEQPEQDKGSGEDSEKQ